MIQGQNNSKLNLDTRAQTRDYSIFNFIQQLLFIENRIQISKNKSNFISNLIRYDLDIRESEINNIIKEPKLSVADKPFPLNVKNYKNKNDYFSVAPYWWPLIKGIKCSPYIWKDGERNPESILLSPESKLMTELTLFTFKRISKLSIFYLKKRTFDFRIYFRTIKYLVYTKIKKNES